MSWPVGSMEKHLSRFSEVTEFSPEPEVEQNNLPEIDQDAYSPPKFEISNDQRINEIYSETTLKKQSPKNEWLLKSEVNHSKIEKYKNRDEKKIRAESKKIDAIPYIQVQFSSSSNPLTVGQVPVIKGSFNKYQTDQKKQKCFKETHFPNIIHDYSETILSNHTTSNFKHSDSKKSDKLLIHFNLKISIIVKRKNVSVEEKITACQKVFDEIKQANLIPDQYSFNPIIDLRVKSNQLVDAWNLVEEMRGKEIWPDATTFNIFMRPYAKNNDLFGARGVMSVMQQNGVMPDVATYNILMRICIRKRDLEGARALLSEMRWAGVQPDAVTYTTCMWFYANQGDILSVWNLCDEMNHEGITPDKKMFKVLMKVCLDCGAILKGLKKEGIQPDEANCNAVRNLYNFVFENNLIDNKLIDVLEKMWYLGVMPDTVIYNIILQHYVNYGDGERVLALMSGMYQDNAKPDGTTYNIMMQYYAEKGDLKRMWDLYENMIRAGFKPDEKTITIIESVSV